MPAQKKIKERARFIKEIDGKEEVGTPGSEPCLDMQIIHIHPMCFLVNLTLAARRIMLALMQ